MGIFDSIKKIFGSDKSSDDDHLGKFNIGGVEIKFFMPKGEGRYRLESKEASAEATTADCAAVLFLIETALNKTHKEIFRTLSRGDHSMSLKYNVSGTSNILEPKHLTAICSELQAELPNQKALHDYLMRTRPLAPVQAEKKPEAKVKVAPKGVGERNR